VIRLGIDTYSIRSSRWKLDQMLDYAEAQKLDAIQASAVDFESFDDTYLKAIRERSSRLGITVEPGFGCISPVSRQWNPKQENPTKYLQHAIRVTKALGGRSFRVFVGGASDRAAGTSIAALMESAIQGIRSVSTEARDAGVKVAIENHGEFLARHVKTIIEEAGKDIASSCLDSGNPVMLGEDPLLSLETLAPYVTSTHIRDSVIYEHPRGAAVQWVALGDGTIDMIQFTRRFRELCPQAPMLLEVITGRPPAVLAYLEAAYWKGFPDTPAAEFARFVSLAKKGHPFMKTMLIPEGGTVPEEYRAALVLQERRDLERSLEYARKTLDIGVRWRSPA
jgi:sugar phosphate isomerase/epimerase